MHTANSTSSEKHTIRSICGALGSVIRQLMTECREKLEVWRTKYCTPWS